MLLFFDVASRPENASGYSCYSVIVMSTEAPPILSENLTLRWDVPVVSWRPKPKFVLCFKIFLPMGSLGIKTSVLLDLNLISPSS